MECMSTIIQVVNGGTDWVAIAGAGATVVAAVGGIWGTAWQARRAREATTGDLKTSLDATTENLRLSINAQEDQARRVEKREVYAKLLTAAGNMAAAQLTYRLDKTTGKDGDFFTLFATWEKLLAAVNEVRLIAPNLEGPLGRLVVAHREFSEATHAGTKVVKGEDDKTIGPIIDELSAAMIADLAVRWNQSVQPPSDG